MFSGKNLAAKVMHGTGELRKWMNNELDIMNHLNHPNIIRPYDSLISSKSFTIIEELYPFSMSFQTYLLF